MADYDVGVIGLTSPPTSSVLTPYRPAVSVHNNGIHDALASGTLRIYAADRLIFTTELYSATIPPGETRNALGTDYWTPPAEGKYLVIADVTCPLDQVESNNHLSPTTVMVLGGPPPPPTTVTPHSSQHEDGGADEINIDGMHGRVADAQTALAHKDTHEAGGADPINVNGLLGILAEGQPIADHRESHEDHGGDELNVEGLRGKLYNVQKPDVHNNSAHDPNYSINKHGAVDHNADVEAVSRKGTANGYAGLGINALVPSTQLAPMPTPPPANYVLRSDQSWGEGAAGAHKASHQNGGGDEISIAGLSGKAADAQTPDSTLVHKTTHENGGGDEISIAGLSGKAADAQTPDSTLTHGNEVHTAAFEVTSAKGAASGYTPLGADSLVPIQYLPAGAIPPNASSTLIALNTPQLIDQLGDTLTFGGIVSGTAIKANWAMRVIITGWIDPHVDATNMQILGKMSQELVETWLCSAVLAFAASPVLGVPFRYEALLVFRPGSLSSANSLGNPTLEARSADISQTWDVTKWTSWQWYVHLGIPLLSVHVSGRQCILEPFG